MTWSEIVGQLLTKLLEPVGLIGLFLFPLFLLGYLLFQRKKHHREQSIEPFTDMPLRAPGESLRLKIEELADEFDTAVATASFAGIGAFCMVAASPPNQKLQIGLGVGTAALITYILTGRTIFRVQRLLWDYRLGFAGERATGEELNQLLANGFKVFHDLPFDGYNIDHVIVGPPGVFAVETKARRKPADLKGIAKATVIFDGTTLKFPRSQEDEPIAQARLNAKTLSNWLSKSTGEHTPVSAIVALPGWMVERKVRSDVNVLNPKEIAKSFPSNPVSPLSPERIQRIVYQLTERCRLAKPT